MQLLNCWMLQSGMQQRWTTSRDGNFCFHSNPGNTVKLL